MQRPWNSLRRFLSLTPRPRTIVRPRPTRQRLCLESLEDRVVPTVVYNSALGGDTVFWVPGNSAGKPDNQVQTGPISNNPSALNSTTVYLDFWGNSWTESNAASRANDAQSIIQSNFFSQLSDYGFKGTISYGGYTIDNTETSDGNSGDPQNGQNTATEIQNLLNGKLATDPNLPTSSWLRPQDNKPQDSPIYIVVYDNGNNAFNTPASYTSSLKMNEISIGDSQGLKDGFTDLFSHEMAERISAGDGTGIEMNATNANTDGEYQGAQISDNEPDDSNYTYRINGENGQLVQAYWSLTYNGFVVPDGNSQTVYLNPVWQSSPSLHYTGTCGLVVNGGQLANPDDTITLGETPNDGVSVNLNGELFQFDDVFINNININTDQASSTVNVLATPVGTSTWIEDQGNDTVVIGQVNGAQGRGLGYLGNIKGSVAVAANGDIGEPGSTVLYVDDSFDTVGQQVTMKNGEILYGDAAPIYYNPSSFSTGDVTELFVYAGSGSNTFNVQSTSQLYYGNWLNTGTGNDTVNVYATQGWLEVNNPGDDTLNVGLGNTSNLNGSVDAYGAGSTRLYINDSNDTTGRTVTMNDGSLFGLGSGGIYWTPTSASTGGVAYIEVDGGSGGNTFNVNNTSNIYDGTFLNTGTGNDTVNVYATQSGLDVYNSGGFDVTNIGQGNMGSINGIVDVYGPGSTELALEDGSDTTARTVTMNDGSITGLGGGTGTIFWTPTSSSSGGVDYLSVYGSQGGSTYTINNISNLFDGTFLYTGTGNDTVNVSATQGSGSNGGLYLNNQGGNDSVVVGLGSMANIKGIVYVDGFGATALLVDDHLDSTSRTATITGVPAYGQVIGLGNAGSITYASGVTALTIDGPSKASTYNIQSTSPYTFVTVNAGVGNDTFNLGSGNSLGGLQGALTLNGGGGTNIINANDSSSASGQSYTLSATQLAGSDFAPITYAYASIHALNVTGSGNDTLTILTPVPVVATTFNGGSSTNTLVGPNASSLTTWTISGANSGKVDSVAFSNFQNLVGGTSSDAFAFTTSTASLSGTLNGGGGTNNTNTLSYSTLGSSYLVNGTLSSNTAGSATAIGHGFSNINSLAGSTDTANTLTGPNGTNVWTITGNNAGSVNTGPIRPFAFTGMAHLVGGTGVDNFRFSGTSGNIASINGGGAPAGQGDWLSYSLLPSTSTVTVNLATGSASNVNGGAAGAVTNIQNVIGSGGGTNNLTGDAQGNILIGGSGLNTLVGGSGGSLLIGGSGNGSITGGSGSDILIAGTTTYNAATTAGQDALMSILAELQSADTFAHKVSDLINGNNLGGGSDLNGSNKLTWGGTVRASTGAFTLSGDPSASSNPDWFFGNASSTVSDFNDDGMQDEHNNNAIGVF